MKITSEDVGKHSVSGGYITLGETKKNKWVTLYNVMCTCGKVNWVSKRDFLRNKNGCLDCSSIMKMNQYRKHKVGQEYEYNTYRAMFKRCYNEKHKAYKYYGGRGIKVCDRWIESFDNFYQDMGPRPSSRYSLDRINNNGNYSPENCRWATHRTQMGNRRGIILIKINKKTKSLTEWCRFFKKNYSTIYSRINSSGWDIRDALELKEKDIVTYFNPERGS